MDSLTIISWIAVFLLSISYWFQIWKIHVHKEVRDLSLTYHFLLASGFAILALTAYAEGSTIFLIKQIATTIPVVIIIAQIFYHKQDRWHDDLLPHCKRCDEELEEDWICCPYCAQGALVADKSGSSSSTLSVE